MSAVIDGLSQATDSRYSLIELATLDEHWILDDIGKFAAGFDPALRVVTWRSTTGLESEAAQGGSSDPLTALISLRSGAGAGIYVFLDLDPSYSDARVIRAVKDLADAWRDSRDRVLIVVSSRPALPDDVAHLFYRIDARLPAAAEMLRLVDEQLAALSLDARQRQHIAFTLQGLSLTEAGHALSEAVAGDSSGYSDIVASVHRAKKSRISGQSSLEFVEDVIDMSRVGGLHGLKSWIDARTRLFNAGVETDSDMPVPKGILIMGISGCGKSLTAKVLASRWQLPLFRLDMNMIFSGAGGNAEASFNQALRNVESVAPALLWIDEIENGLGATETEQATHSHILSAFLTWMQEKPPNIFVAATANRIEALPAEMIRKGRFDQVFFCDLPTTAERKEIIGIHLRDNHLDPDDYQLDRLARATAEWNGAEIEQAIIAARIEAKDARPPTTNDVLDQVEKIVPLSRTMSEQIKRIRDWAWDRATPASGGLGSGFNLDED